MSDATNDLRALHPSRDFNTSPPDRIIPVVAHGAGEWIASPLPLAGFSFKCRSPFTLPLLHPSPGLLIDRKDPGTLRWTAPTLTASCHLGNLDVVKPYHGL